jgi:decaprenylphospho-beta-D-ribofuranose 2-oxidase
MSQRLLAKPTCKAGAQAGGKALHAVTRLCARTFRAVARFHLPSTGMNQRPLDPAAVPAAVAAGTANAGGHSEMRSWGGLRATGDERFGEDLESLTYNANLSRGLGRSYGDSSLPALRGDRVVNTRCGDRVLAFDPDSGRMRAEAGLDLVRLRHEWLPRGFFTPVTPGTSWVSLGGMVASDVHGKNHHVNGCFGEHVHALKLRTAANEIRWCSPTQDADLFWATVGGMGLTGHILEVEFSMERIPSPWIWQESQRVRNIEEFVDALATAAPIWPFTVGWIDCLAQGRDLGRGHLVKGRWAQPDEVPSAPPRTSQPSRVPLLRLPFDFPSWALNDWTIHAFNFAYYNRQFSERTTACVDHEPFFYPLDFIHEWSRMYGRRGFTQHQCVIPQAAGSMAVVRYVELLAKLGGSSFLCVIKDCGPEGHGMLSFPMRGVSIALDIPHRNDTQAMIDQLNQYVINVGGRIYLTKDSFTRPEHFRAMEPRLDRFLEVRRKWDPHGRLHSAQSQRLFGF